MSVHSSTQLRVRHPVKRPDLELWKRAPPHIAIKAVEGRRDHPQVRDHVTGNWVDAARIAARKRRHISTIVAVPSSLPVRPSRKSRVRAGLVYAFLTALVVFGAQRGWQAVQTQQTDLRTSNIARVQSAAAAATQVRTDATGAVAEISGSNPRDILIAFCTRSGTYEPIALTAPGAGVRIGLVREPGDSSSRYTIEIVRRAGANDWVAGDGVEPLRAFPAQESPPGTPTVPVDWGS